MPIFRYQCEACGQEMELLVARFDSEVSCPKCGSAQLKKLPGVFAAVTKTGPASCAARHDCPSAGGHQCGGGCCHGH